MKKLEKLFIPGTYVIILRNKFDKGRYTCWKVAHTRAEAIERAKEDVLLPFNLNRYYLSCKREKEEGSNGSAHTKLNHFTYHR